MVFYVEKVPFEVSLVFQDRTDRVHLQGVKSLGLLTLRRFCCFWGLRARERGSLITARATSISKRLSDTLPQADLPHFGSSQPSADGPLDDALDGAVSDPTPVSQQPMDAGPYLASSLPSVPLNPAGHPIYPHLADYDNFRGHSYDSWWDYWTRHGWLDAMVASQAGRGDDAKTSASKANTASPSRSWHCSRAGLVITLQFVFMRRGPLIYGRRSSPLNPKAVKPKTLNPITTTTLYQVWLPVPVKEDSASSIKDALDTKGLM